jgi:hypothetical protein
MEEGQTRTTSAEREAERPTKANDVTGVVTRSVPGAADAERSSGARASRGPVEHRCEGLSGTAPLKMFGGGQWARGAEAFFGLTRLVDAVASFELVVDHESRPVARDRDHVGVGLDAAPDVNPATYTLPGGEAPGTLWAPSSRLRGRRSVGEDGRMRHDARHDVKIHPVRG